ncbi:hypothetical protein LMK08_16525 [Metapseudomonas furukawaii]|uniref:hypothetical protein n=1 Tax=Metapseudomonas furukawaii TaxID=1149133 RepID=UPI00227B3A7B|nr:hypothetical protein [Pseudomonas furukawaii]WAG76980.1 hypothetical protein LMK08_16525 [Pseudomonas furukawaii]
MSNVIGLADNGLTPALRHASETLGNEIWDAIDKATAAGIPAGMLVGHLEFVKAAIIDQNFRSVEREG